MKSSCTHCRKELETRYYEGLAVQLCKDCKGVYLSERKLAIIEDRHEIHNSKDALPRRRHSDARPCPQCDQPMQKVKHGEAHPVFVDYCESCHGIWLDKGLLPYIDALYEVYNDEADHRHVA